MTDTLVALQHFEGRLYRVSELIEVAAFANGYLRAPELDGRVPMRYRRSWRVRTLIQMSRQTETASGLAYGPDWCGKEVHRIERVGLPPEKQKKSTLPPEYIGDAHTFNYVFFPPRSGRTGVPLKESVKDYLNHKRIPFKLLRILTEKIRERDRRVWVAYSVQQELGQRRGETLPLAAE